MRIFGRYMRRNDWILSAFRANMYLPKGKTKNGGKDMRTTFYLDGKKITQKAVKEQGRI